MSKIHPVQFQSLMHYVLANSLEIWVSDSGTRTTDARARLLPLFYLSSTLDAPLR